MFQRISTDSLVVSREAFPQTPLLSTALSSSQQEGGGFSIPRDPPPLLSLWLPGAKQGGDLAPHM